MARRTRTMWAATTAVVLAVTGTAAGASGPSGATPSAQEPEFAAPFAAAPPVERVVHDEGLVAPPRAIGRELTGPGPLEVTASALTAAPVCDDGTSGNRVQAVYVRGRSQPDSYDAKVEKIREALMFADGVVDASTPDREMHLRLVHSGAPGCVISVLRAVVPDSVADSIDEITQYLTTQPPFQDPSRKYLAFAEVNAPSNCGIAYSWNDESPGGGNLNNGFLNLDSATPAAFHATVGKYCWDVSYDSSPPDGRAIAAAHETFHMLGSVSELAPHGTRFGHCTDENDIMCYQDEPSIELDYVCGEEPATPGTLSNTEPENFLLDCNDDDYFDPTRPTAGYLATAWNTADSDFLYGNEGDRFVPLPTPRRALDTRAVADRLDPREVSVDLVGNDFLGIDRAATAVVLNVTAVDPTQQMNITVWPTGLPKPLASNLNVTQGKVVANQVTVKLGAGGRLGSGAVSLSTNAGETDVLIDVVGYYVKSRPGAGTELRPVAPYRVMSSRDAIGPFSTPWGPGQTRSVPITGLPTDATAVVLNVTALRATAPRSHLRVFPAGQPLPLASSLNFERGVNTPNLVTVGLRGGRVDIYNANGTVDVIADVVGYFAPSASIYVPIANERVLDSRAASRIGPLTRWGPDETKVLPIGGVDPIPADATAVVLNVTGVDATSNTNLRLFPPTAVVPTISNLNLLGGGPPRPNAVVVGLGVGGDVAIYNFAGSVDVVVDVVGYYIER